MKQKIEIVDNLKYTEKQLDALTEALKTSKQSFIDKIGEIKNADSDIIDAITEEVNYIGSFKNTDTGKYENVYSDKNGLLFS